MEPLRFRGGESLLQTARYTNETIAPLQTLMEASQTTIVENSAVKGFALGRSPSRVEVSLLWLLSALLFVVVLTHFRSYVAQVDAFGDNDAYLQAANAIRHWNFHGVAVKQFWGFPYAIAGLSSLGIPARVSGVSCQRAAGVASMGAVGGRLFRRDELVLAPSVATRRRGTAVCGLALLVVF